MAKHPCHSLCNESSHPQTQTHDVCNFMLVEESGQTKHLKTLMLITQMTIKTLYLVRDVEQISPYRLHSMQQAPDYDNTSVAKFVQNSAPWAK